MHGATSARIAMQGSRLQSVHWLTGVALTHAKWIRLIRGASCVNDIGRERCVNYRFIGRNFTQQIGEIAKQSTRVVLIVLDA
jgi:hypothetical protein